MFAGLKEQPYVYFVHSYYLKAKDPSIVKATTEYGVTIHASVEKGNLFACQFHPEKSSTVGLQISEEFCGNIAEACDVYKESDSLSGCDMAGVW